MLGRFTEDQQVLLACYWALSDAHPPHKGELRKMFRSKVDTSTAEHAVISARRAEDFHIGIAGALTELSKATQKYPRYAFDRFRRGTGVPNHRKVRVCDN